MITSQSLRISILSVVSIALIGLGYYLGYSKEKEVVVQERVIHEKGETQIRVVDHIVTVTKTVRGDGTVTEVTRREDKDRSTDKKTDIVDKNKKTDTVMASTQYSLGLRYVVQYSELFPLSTNPSLDNLEVTAGRRLLGDLWLDAGIGIRSLSLGVRYEF